MLSSNVMYIFYKLRSFSIPGVKKCKPFIISCVCICVLSSVWLFANPWTVARQAPLSMEFSRQEYWSALPFSTPGSLSLSGWFFSFFLSKKLLILFVCVCKLLSHVRLFLNPWTVARQAPLSIGILGARILEWVVMSFSRGSSWPRHWTSGRYFTVWATREVS